jgi:hypothetical protein
VLDVLNGPPGLHDDLEPAVERPEVAGLLTAGESCRHFESGACEQGTSNDDGQAVRLTRRVDLRHTVDAKRSLSIVDRAIEVTLLTGRLAEAPGDRRHRPFAVRAHDARAAEGNENRREGATG